MVFDFQDILLLQFRIEGVVRRQTGKIQFRGVIKPFVRKIRFGFGNFVGFEEGRIGHSAGQVLADIKKLEAAGSDLCVCRSFLDDSELTAVFIIFVWVDVSSQPRYEVRFDQGEIILGAIEAEHGYLLTIMVEGAQQPSHFLTGAFPLWD